LRDHELRAISPPRPSFTSTGGGVLAAHDRSVHVFPEQVSLEAQTGVMSTSTPAT
jgi:hypothetical protein